jgi:serine O-acetyltransferase
MSKFFDTIKLDVERQYFFEGKTGFHIGFFQIVIRSFSPRFMPVLIYRISHYFYRKSPVLSKVFSLFNFLVFGIEIAGKCSIGPGLFFPHTLGTVIGAEIIGARATIYHGVTLGAKEVDISYLENRRPVIGDDVVIGSGAKILGGVLIGNKVRIGANSLVIRSIPDNSTVFSPLPIVVLKDE